MPAQQTKSAFAKSRLVQTLREHFTVLVSVFVCLYVLFGLFAFLCLQGDLNDWYAFMRNDAHVTLFATYFLAGIVEIGRAHV